MGYKITTVHEMLVVCHTTSSVRVGCKDINEVFLVCAVKAHGEWEVSSSHF